MTAQPALLEVRGLSKSFATPRGALRALDGVAFDLERGGSLGLVGESGCGKTTLARCLVGLERPSAGSIRLGGVELSGLSHRGWLPHRRHVQMVFQDPGLSLDPRQRVGAIVAEPLAIHRIGHRSSRRERALELLGKVGLSPEHAERFPHELSGGQRQRVAIARALALGPDVLVCDEPTSALDVRVQAQVLALLRGLQADLGLAILLISHDLAVVRELCREVAVLYLGRIVEQAPAEDLFERPCHPYTRALIAAAPLPDPELEAARAKLVLPGDPPSPLRPPSGCTFHPRCSERARVPQDRCLREAPSLVARSAARRSVPALVACHLADPSGPKREPPPGSRLIHPTAEA